MNKQRLSIIIVSLLGMASTFMPWVSVDGVTENGAHSSSWITFAMFILCIVFALLGKQEKQMILGQRIAVILCSLIAIGYAVLIIWGLNTQMDKVSQHPLFRFSPEAQEMLQHVVVGWGLYVLITAGLLIILLCMVFRKTIESKTEDITTL
jgi:surface polysaccharide O-acyltransferase-like enzyme